MAYRSNRPGRQQVTCQAGSDMNHNSWLLLLTHMPRQIFSTVKSSQCKYPYLRLICSLKLTSAWDSTCCKSSRCVLGEWCHTCRPVCSERLHLLSCYQASHLFHCDRLEHTEHLAELTTFAWQQCTSHIEFDWIFDGLSFACAAYWLKDYELKVRKKIESMFTVPPLPGPSRAICFAVGTGVGLQVL